MRACIHAYIHTYMHACMHDACVLAFMHACMMHACMHACRHTYILMHAYSCCMHACILMQYSVMQAHAHNCVAFLANSVTVTLCSSKALRYESHMLVFLVVLRAWLASLVSRWCKDTLAVACSSVAATQMQSEQHRHIRAIPQIETRRYCGPGGVFVGSGPGQHIGAFESRGRGLALVLPASARLRCLECGENVVFSDSETSELSGGRELKVTQCLVNYLCRRPCRVDD